MSIKKSLAWMGSAQLVVFLLYFATSIVLARYLTPHEFGIAAVGSATVAMLSILQGFGLQALIIREKELKDSLVATIFTINAAICLTISLSAAALSFLGAKFFGANGVRDVILVLAITPLFGIISFLPAAHMERDGRFKEIALITTLMNVTNSCATIVFAILGFKYMSMAYAAVLSAALLSFLFVVVGSKHSSFRIGVSNWRRVIESGAQLLLVSALTTFSQKISEISLAKLLGLGALGLYNRAGGMNSMLWGNVHWMARRIVLVDFADLHRQGVPLRDRYMKTMAMVVAMLWPGFAGIAILAEPIIALLYGEKWLSAALPLTFLAIASMVLVTIALTWEVFTVTGNLRAQTRIEAIRAPISVALFVGGCLISLEAAAVSRIVDAAVAYGLYRRHLNDITGTGFADFRRIYGEGMILTLAAVAPAGVLVFLTSEDVPGPLPMMFAILFGIALWAGMLFVMRHPLADEVMITARHRLARKPA